MKAFDVEYFLFHILVFKFNVKGENYANIITK